VKEHLSGTTSPVACLLDSLGPVMRQIAPEQFPAFLDATDGLSLQVVDGIDFLSRFDATTRTIEISTRAVELLWCCSLAYSVLPRRADGAMKLLKWAFESFLNKSSGPWPEELPRPSSAPAHASDEHTANELAFAALAFVLHHELAHARLKHEEHPTGIDSIEQEREADYAAAEWILGPPSRADVDIDIHGAPFTTRSLGITIALSVLVAVGIHTGRHGGATHPRDFDRLINTLERHIPDPQHPAWEMAVAILKLHMESEQIRIPSATFPTVRDRADAYADVLAARGSAVSTLGDPVPHSLAWAPH
jgi:hypothetical protein